MASQLLEARKLGCQQSSGMGDLSTEASNGSRDAGCDAQHLDRFYSAVSATGESYGSPAGCLAGCLWAAASDPRNTDLDYYHSSAVMSQALSKGEFTKVRTLSDCCRDNGKVELHRWQAEGKEVPVVVKRVLAAQVTVNQGRESNERLLHGCACGRDAEDTLTEIGVYYRLFSREDVPRYLLKMYLAFQPDRDIWLVLEHADGGDLFNVVQAERATGVRPQQMMTWMWQLTHAVSYLHKLNMGHRDLSIENILLCGQEVRVMDFGQAVLSHAPSGVALRYFRPVGKPYYRAPECHVPTGKLRVDAPAGALPGEVVFVEAPDASGRRYLCEVQLPADAAGSCEAEPYGYAVQPIDTFACGVCFFILAMSMPPWKEACMSDPHFAWIKAQGVPRLLQAWKKVLPPGATELLSSMLAVDPTKRPTMEDCCNHAWFEQLRGTEVPCHSASQWCVAEMRATTQLFADAHAGAGLSGDFYAQGAEEICRSAESDPQVVEPPKGLDLAPEDWFAQPPAVAATAEQLPRFGPETRLPPPAPADADFALEPTTLYLPSTSAAEIGNRVVGFFGADAMKVNTEKFTIKARVSGALGACTLKVRIYTQGQGLAVEFQRRNGSSLALHEVFAQASDVLECRAAVPHSKEEPEESSRCTPPTPSPPAMPRPSGFRRRPGAHAH